MHILIACDKFKGSLSAMEVAHHLRDSLQTVFPGATYDICPIADGGEGTTEAMVGAMGADWHEARVVDAQHRPIKAHYAIVHKTHQAVMEMSAASGLHRVTDIPLRPCTASTLGTGQMMAQAVNQGAQSILIGIGGSATNDAGLGVAVALGYRFLRQDNVVQPTLETLLEVDKILPPTKPWLIPVQVACDVDNPLLGPRGCTRVYGPQKGVQDFAWFEQRLEHLTFLVKRDLGKDFKVVPGAGAAGGLGFGLMTFANAQLVPGFELIAQHMQLAQRIQNSDIVFTGEGRMDAQSLQGKGPIGVARLCQRLHKPIIGVVGSFEKSTALDDVFDLLIAIKPEAMDLADAMKRTPELIRVAINEQREILVRISTEL
ncbi:MAG TPA: glycerate kinase [Opitutae bacterium]|nr:glycerate kinase [Opitutae bacterium]